MAPDSMVAIDGFQCMCEYDSEIASRISRSTTRNWRDEVVCASSQVSKESLGRVGRYFALLKASSVRSEDSLTESVTWSARSEAATAHRVHASGHPRAYIPCRILHVLGVSITRA